MTDPRTMPPHPGQGTNGPTEAERWILSDPGRPLEERAFQSISLLGGLVALFVIIPINAFVGLSPWVAVGIAGYGLAALALAWLARRGSFCKWTLVLLFITCLDALWFPNGGSQGSIGLYFIIAALYMMFFFRTRTGVAGTCLLMANIVLLFLAERAWPGLAHPFQTPDERVLDLLSGYLVSVFISVLIFGVVKHGFNQERERAEATLRQLTASEARYRVVLENSADAIWTMDPEGRLTFISPAVTRITGYSPEEAKGMTLDQILRPGSAAIAWERLRQTLATVAAGAPFPGFRAELEINHKDGSTIWAEVTAKRLADPDGGIAGISGSTRDVSERKRNEQGLLEREAQLRAIFDSSQDAICVTRSGRFEMVNPSFLVMFGFDRTEELVGAALLERIGPDGRDTVQANIQARSQGLPAPTGYEVTALRKDGSPFRMEIHVSTYEQQGLHTVSILRDVTAREQLEQERRQLEAQSLRREKMESLGSLAGGVAHDMNNVLGAILALATVNQHRAPEGSALRRDLDTVVKACQRGGTLVRGLLGFAREELPEVRALSLNLVVLEAVALLERTTLQKVRLDLDLADDLRTVTGDPASLGHGLMNLCVNAVDAMAGGGTLTFRTRNEGTSAVLLEVIDTGSGMPPEVLARALDPFFTTKPTGKGTGLGLPIVYSTVKAHQGRMEIQSEPGRGTRITIQLPACAPAAEVPAPAAARPEAAGRPLQVLLVDDDDLVVEAVQAILRALGHAVTATPGGIEALARVAAGLQPDVVILDLNMPGLDGAGTLPRLLAARPGLPVLLATGRVDQAALDLVKVHPSVQLLAKPFGIRELQLRLDAIALCTELEAP